VGYNAGVLRLIGFFVLVLVLLQVLRALPVVGGVFQVPLLGFWLTAILLSVLFSKLAADALDRRKANALQRQLGAVDTPHNKGKLGVLLLTQRRYRKALPYLEQAYDGEPESTEWAYRLGVARLRSGDHDGAVEALERAIATNEEYAYGQVRMRLAETLAKRGDHEQALACLERFELNHGPNPESAFRRGSSLRALGRKPDARAAFEEVARLASQLARFQRKGAAVWVARAQWAKWG